MCSSSNNNLPSKLFFFFFWSDLFKFTVSLNCKREELGTA